MASNHRYGSHSSRSTAVVPGGRPAVTDRLDPAGEADAALDVEAGPAAVGVVVGVGGLCFLLEPLVGTVALGGVRVRPVALSVVVLAVGFCLGAVVFRRRGHRRFALAHAVFGLVWIGFGVGTAVRSGPVVVGAVVVAVAGAGFLIARARDRHATER